MVKVTSTPLTTQQPWSICSKSLPSTCHWTVETAAWTDRIWQLWFNRQLENHAGIGWKFASILSWSSLSDSICTFQWNTPDKSAETSEEGSFKASSKEGFSTDFNCVDGYQKAFCCWKIIFRLDSKSFAVALIRPAPATQQAVAKWMVCPVASL